MLIIGSKLNQYTRQRTALLFLHQVTKFIMLHGPIRFQISQLWSISRSNSFSILTIFMEDLSLYIDSFIQFLINSEFSKFISHV